MASTLARWDKTMWGRKIQHRFDAGVWSGHVDLTRAVVMLSLFGGVALLWLSVAILLKDQL